MSRIKIDSKKIVSSFESIEIELDGKVYVYDKPVTTEFMMELMNLAMLAEEKMDVDAGAKQLIMMTGMSIEEARKFDVRVIQEVILEFSLEVAKGKKKTAQKSGSKKPLK